MLKPGADLGRLKLQEPLGSGGMGAVFAAVDEKLKREVAVKVLRRSGADEHRRLLGEARMLSRLDHPHVCRVYDVVEHEDEEGEVLSLLVMERVRGLNLAEILAQPGSGRLSFADRLRIGEQIADALGAAHAEGIVHRDLKPGNVMVTSSDTVKVLDFGLARPIEIEETQVLDGLDEQDELRVEELEPLGKPDSAAPTYWRSIAGGSTRGVAGTPAYMSPEQARAERATAASDIYSFGLLFHELFGGRSPYGDLADSPLLGKVVAEGKTRPLQGVDADLVSLAERMKAAAPADRPTAHEVKAELRRIADKPRRRRRRWIAAAAVALVLAGVAKYTFDLRHERNVALEARREAEEVSEFLVRLFEHENPISQTSEAATIEDLLALAVLRIDRDLADQPHARGRLLQTLGRAYSGRGMYDEADPLLAEALALARDRPEDRKNLLGALNARWSLENHWSRWPKAAGLAREALELVRRIYGSDPEEPEGVLETATALMRLAQTLSAQQGAQEAEELMAELTELSRRKGEDGRPILDESMRVEVLQTLARVKAYRSQFGESIQALQEVVRVVESSGPGSVTPADGVLAYLDLCNMLLTAGRQGEAEVPCRRQLELIEELLPSSHPWQVTGRQALASWLWTVGGNEEAESLLMAALQRAEATDPESLLTAGVLYALSDHFSRLGRYETAEPFGARAYARFRDLLGEDNERTLAVALGHAALLLRLERYSEAETILRRLLDEDRIADYADRRLVGGSRVQLAKLLLKQGHGAECVQEAERAAIELAEVYGADHQRVADARTIAEDCRHLSQGAQQ